MREVKTYYIVEIDTNDGIVFAPKLGNSFFFKTGFGLVSESNVITNIRYYSTIQEVEEFIKQYDTHITDPLKNAKIVKTIII